VRTSVGRPLYEKLLLREMTKSSRKRPSSVMISSVTPLAPVATPAVVARTRVLAQGETLWMKAPAGVVTCVHGTLWLTYDGQQRDIILEPGETHACIAGTALAVHALGRAQVTVR